MRAGHGRHGSPFQPTRMLRLTDPIMDGWPSLPRGGPSYREAKGGALRPGRVAERWDKIPWFSRPSLPRGGPSYREAKGGALRPGRVAERWGKIPWFSRLSAVHCDSISTTHA